MAALPLGILRQIGIALEFIVAPAFAAGVVRPFGRVRGRCIGTVELIRPNQRVAGGEEGSGLRVTNNATASWERQDRKECAKEYERWSRFSHPKQHRVKSAPLRKIQRALERALLLVALLLKLDDSVEKSFGARRASRNVNINGNDLVAALHDSVVVQGAAGRSATAHVNAPLGP